LSSPYSCLLETNHPVPDCDVPRLRGILSEGRAQVAHLDDRIACLQSELQRLVPERNELDENVRRYAGFISPLRGRMPNELLSNIFLLAVSDTIDIDTPVEQAEIATRRAWIIAQVCHHWRAIAMSLPSLWSV
ncbi:hypothetical protein B0H10DRAFT_1748280, partial [Mycena sp. CBHHK59/15]